jgi:hypothetical protein
LFFRFCFFRQGMTQFNDPAINTFPSLILPPTWTFIAHRIANIFLVAKFAITFGWRKLQTLFSFSWSPESTSSGSLLESLHLIAIIAEHRRAERLEDLPNELLAEICKLFHAHHCRDCKDRGKRVPDCTKCLESVPPCLANLANLSVSPTRVWFLFEISVN